MNLQMQISSDHDEWLQQQTELHFVAHVTRTNARANNVPATIKATNATLAPLIVMTPRSDWWHSTSERRGGIVCWLEIVRVLATTPPARDVHVLSSSGHEWDILA